MKNFFYGLPEPELSDTTETKTKVKKSKKKKTPTNKEISFEKFLNYNKK
jgi:hypothetical protein